MQSEFSPPITRLDVVLWFLRVQMWLSVVAFVLGFASSSMGLFVALSLQNLATSGIPILILALFPRVLASASLGSTAREPLQAFDLRTLIGRCVGLTLFVRSLGNAALLTFTLVDALISRGTFSFGSGYSSLFFLSSAITTALSFFLGFAFAFGPAIRDSFRSR